MSGAQPVEEQPDATEDHYTGRNMANLEPVCGQPSATINPL